MLGDIFLEQWVLSVFFISLSLQAKQSSHKRTEFCTKADFTRMDKIDIHCHIIEERTAFMEKAVEDNFRIVTITTDAFQDIHRSIGDQTYYASIQHEKFPENLYFLTTFSMKDWEKEGWQQSTISALAKAIRDGAKGVKIWKNIGMVEKDQRGNFIMVDEPLFDPVFDFLEENDIPVTGHLGEPKNCWLPLEEMTVNNDREYYRNHPEYHMFLHPEFPSYQEQITAMENRLRRHPGLRYIGAHLASLEWSLEELSRLLDKYPNLKVDTAARISHLQKHAQLDWHKTREFFIQYQNRIVYGTDEGDYPGCEQDPDKLKIHLHEVWTRDWRFFTTDETMCSWEVDGEFRGLRLPMEVVEKLYFHNAVEIYPCFISQNKS